MNALSNGVNLSLKHVFYIALLWSYEHHFIFGATNIYAPLGLFRDYQKVRRTQKVGSIKTKNVSKAPEERNMTMYF